MMRWQTLCAAMVLVAGAALAQERPAAAAPAPAVAAHGAELPDAEKVRRSSEALARMRDVLRDTQGRLEEARRTRDVVKLNCVNEKLTQVKGLLRISEQAATSLQEAVARHEATASEHELTKVSIARQKVEQLHREADACIGQLAFRTDEALSVEVEEPDDLFGADPTAPPPPPPVTVRAPPASPSL